MLRYDHDENMGPVLNVNLDNRNNMTHYTDIKMLFDVILDMFIRNTEIFLITADCISGDHGFATVQIQYQ